MNKELWVGASQLNIHGVSQLNIHWVGHDSLGCNILGSTEFHILICTRLQNLSSTELLGPGWMIFEFYKVKNWILWNPYL